MRTPQRKMAVPLASGRSTPLLRALSGAAALLVSITFVHAQSTGTLVAAKLAAQEGGTAPAPLMGGLEQAVFARINGVRHQHGLKPVAFLPDLLGPARRHSRYMAKRDRLTHQGPDGLGPGERLDAAAIRWVEYGENVALVKGYQDPSATAVEAWLKSPGHASNILDASLAESAVGVAMSADGTYYLTQVFVTR